MNLENLKLKQESLFKYMESNNYSSSFITAIRREIRWLLDNKDGYKWYTYDEALHDRASAYDMKIFSNKKTIGLAYCNYVWRACRISPSGNSQANETMRRRRFATGH